MIKVVLITTGQPSTNPRIVKEANALHAAGYDVTVLYSYLISWAAEKDKKLLQHVLWNYKRIGGQPDDISPGYWFTRIRFKLAGILNRYVGQAFLLAERTQARAYDELLLEAKKIKADWYIGHNLGSLAIAVKAAKYNTAKAGFDFEDYHRGEFLQADKTNLDRITWLESKYMSGLKYYTTSSNLITEAVQRDHPDFSGEILTLFNCFPLTQQPPFKEKSAEDESLNLFWFSQTIGKNRGLEILIDALKYLNDPSIHLTLAGRRTEEMDVYLQIHGAAIMNNIHFAGIIQPENLPWFASKFDIGLALETGFSVNNNFALSNKILTYLLAGNAIILSETAMQLAFNERFQVGETINLNNKNELAQKINLYKDINKLNKQKLYNYDLAKDQLNWEVESKKLVEVIKSLEN